MSLKPSSFPERGLYLLFPGGDVLVLTPRTVEERAQAIFADPTKLTPAIQEASSFQLCSVCPKHGTPGVICHAIRPMLAFWENVDHYLSCDQVTAVYRGTDTDQIIVSETTLQYGLQYLSMMSLMHYCEIGKKYWKYFSGTHPLMDTPAVVSRVYLNMFWMNQGNLDATRKLITEFHDEITITTRCQMDRIRLFCKKDAFLNALVITQIASEFLALNAEKFVQQQMNAFTLNT